MVIRHSIKELLAESMVTRPMKCIVIGSFIICMQAFVRDCAIGGSLHGALRTTTRIVRVLNKFCTRSERITQNISDISREYWA